MLMFAGSSQIQEFLVALILRLFCRKAVFFCVGKIAVDRARFELLSLSDFAFTLHRCCVRSGLLSFYFQATLVVDWSLIVCAGVQRYHLFCEVVQKTLRLTFSQILKQHPEDLRLPSRAWKVKLIGEGADDAGGVFDDTITEMCQVFCLH